MQRGACHVRPEREGDSFTLMQPHAPSCTLMLPHTTAVPVLVSLSKKIDGRLAKPYVKTAHGEKKTGSVIHNMLPQAWSTRYAALERLEQYAELCALCHLTLSSTDPGAVAGRACRATCMGLACDDGVRCSTNAPLLRQLSWPGGASHRNFRMSLSLSCRAAASTASLTSFESCE
eukprot:5586769-Pleurochrysis_carterae.AAC.1